MLITWLSRGSMLITWFSRGSLMSMLLSRGSIMMMLFSRGSIMMLLSRGSPMVSLDFVVWQVETGLGFRWDEVEEQGGGFPAEQVEVTSVQATSGGSGGALALAAVAPGYLGRRKRLLC